MLWRVLANRNFKLFLPKGPFWNCPAGPARRACLGVTDDMAILQQLLTFPPCGQALRSLLQGCTSQYFKAFLRQRKAFTTSSSFQEIISSAIAAASAHLGRRRESAGALIAQAV
jgi:hypothetical protein